MTYSSKKPKEFKAEYLKDYKEEEFEYDEIPWINAPQINQSISIEV